MAFDPLRRQGERPVGLLNAFHPGFEIGVVRKGRTLLTLSEKPFAVEELDDRSVFRAGDNGIISHEICEEGAIRTFPSNLYHRVELVDPSNETISVNIRRNVFLARRITYRRDGRSRKAR